MPAVPKSSEEKKANGSHCRPNCTVLAVDGKLIAESPVGLTKEARAAWAMAVQCAPAGLLTALDHTVLERWARNYALYRKIAKQLDGDQIVLEGEKGVMLNPLFNALIKVQAVLSQCEKELGFTPVSRARVRVAEEPDTSDNPFDL